MRASPYVVSPEAGKPFVYNLQCQEKGFKLRVIKTFQDEQEASYHFSFAHLNDQGRIVQQDDYKAFAKNKGITRPDHIRAAFWFLTQYFSYKELNYVFTGDNFTVGSYYPVLGKHLKMGVFDLRWD